MLTSSNANGITCGGLPTVNSTMRLTITGASSWVDWSLLPSCPKPLLPQQRTVPFARTAQLWEAPAPIATASVMPWTATGDGRACVVPSPSLPNTLSPQQATAPLTRSAHVCDRPAAIATASERPTTAVAVACGVALVVPLPTCPTLFRPQHRTLLSLMSAQLWRSPDVMPMTPLSPRPT